MIGDQECKRRASRMDVIGWRSWRPDHRASERTGKLRTDFDDDDNIHMMMFCPHVSAKTSVRKIF